MLRPPPSHDTALCPGSPNTGAHLMPLLERDGPRRDFPCAVVVGEAVAFAELGSGRPGPWARTRARDGTGIRQAGTIVVSESWGSVAHFIEVGDSVVYVGGVGVASE